MLFLKGLAMGAANVIPGVSGGTVAFITGIYERLINALKNLDIEAVMLLLKGKLKAFASKVDLGFLSVLFAGVFVSIFSLAKILEMAFLYHEVQTLAFFFGLIVASVFAVSRQISVASIPVILSFIAGAGIATGIAFLPPAQSNDSFLYLMLCGVAAISSMILPGLSGSYVLLLMGNYVLVLRAISSFELSVLVPIALGCAIGLVVLSRVLSWLFKAYKDITIAVLAGFVAGSLLIIWPWKTTVVEMLAGKEKAVGYIWNSPLVDASFFMAVALSVAGFLLVYLMEKYATKAD